MKIQGRLFMGIFLMVLALVVVGAVGVGFSFKIFETQQGIARDQARLGYLHNVSDAYMNDVVSAVQQTRNGNGWSWEDGLAAIQAAEKTSEDNWKSYMDTDKNKNEKYLATIADASLNNNKHLMEQLEEAYSGKDAKLLEILATSVLYPSLQPVTDSLKKLEDLTRQEIKAESDQSDLFYKSSMGMTVVLVVGTILAAFFLNLWFVGGVSRRLGSFVAGFENGVDQVGFSAAQISAANSQAALSVSTAAGSLNQTNASLRLIQNLEQLNEDHSGRINRLAEESKNSLAGAPAHSDQASLVLKSLQDNSQKIAQKIQAIEQIAFQANILAMNAAVEAVRMGPAGKEFSVVSEEIRGLSQRCAELARETTHWASENNHLSATGTAENEGLRRIIFDNQERVKKWMELFSNLEASHFARKKELQDLQATFGQVEKTVQSQTHITEKAVAAVDQMNAQSEKLKTLAQQLAAFSGIREDAASTSAAPAPLRGSKRKNQVSKPAAGASAPPPEMALKAETPPAPAASEKSGWPLLNLAGRTGTNDSKVVRIGSPKID
jgi:methyl-accepting chemotaxis protein